MLVYENMDNHNKEQFLEVTLQLGSYKGVLWQKIIGNNLGLSVLNLFNERSIYSIDDFENTDCEIELLGVGRDNKDWFRYLLKDDYGNIIEGEDWCENFGNMVVKLEIIDCKNMI